MDSIKILYRIGTGPSSSHTMGPRRAAEMFLERAPSATRYRVTLFKSLASTGKGHLTDVALKEVFGPHALEIVWKPDENLPFHPNGMRFEAMDADGRVADAWEVFSVGGGSLSEGEDFEEAQAAYQQQTMESVVRICESHGNAMWELVEQVEGKGAWDHLEAVWGTMKLAIERGLEVEGLLPGGLGVSRKAWTFHRKAQLSGEYFKRGGLVSAYALAVAEENAAGGIIVTAPTCGSCGVLPAVLRYLQETTKCSDAAILRSLATAGLIGTLIKHNASISGAEVGCQGEIGSACAMAAGAAAQLLGGTARQIEYAAEMGLEHNLGLTCDPVQGLVQIPCIERNAFAAKQALSCAEFAIFSGGYHRITFDEVVSVMKETGHALPCLYRETASGGLAAAYQKRPPAPSDSQAAS